MNDSADRLSLLESYGYSEPRYIEHQGWCALQRFIHTTGLCCAIDFHGEYRRRFCFELHRDAQASLAMWDGTGDPPGLWIVEKPAQRLGPGAHDNGLYDDIN